LAGKGASSVQNATEARGNKQVKIRFFNLLLKRDATNEAANHILTKDNTPSFSKQLSLQWN
jgi:hypothetical protein